MNHTEKLISPPLATSYGQDHPIFQYANNILIIMLAEAKQLLFLMCMLHSFATSTGLKVNFNKTIIVPINVDEGKANILAGNLGCKIETMPFTYLGLSLGTTKGLFVPASQLTFPGEKQKLGTNS
jgi:hypothetical protein